MSRAAHSDEAVVERARRILAAKRKVMTQLLLSAVVFLGFSVYVTLLSIRKIENLDASRLTMGFVYGLALAFVWMTFGVAGALCLGKFLWGVGGDFRTQELLVRYHDRLRELQALPEEKGDERERAANRSGPIPKDKAPKGARQASPGERPG
jgi:hypothetical protein